MKFLFNKLQVYKLQSSALCFKNSGKLFRYVCYRVPLCISRHHQVLYRIAALRLFGELPGRPTSVLNTDSTINILLASFQKYSG